MCGERQRCRGVAGECASPRFDRLRDSALITLVARGQECRGIDEFAADVANDEVAAVRDRETAGVRQVSGIGLVGRPERELVQVRQIGGLSGQWTLLLVRCTEL